MGKLDTNRRMASSLLGSLSSTLSWRKREGSFAICSWFRESGSRSIKPWIVLAGLFAWFSLGLVDQPNIEPAKD